MGKASAPPRGLKRYIEWMARGRRTGRTAYVLRESDLPVHLHGSEWMCDRKFNAAEELLHNPEIKAAVAGVLKNGGEVMGGLEIKMKKKPLSSLPSDTRLEDVDLPTRVQKALALNGIRTVGDLRELSEATLLTFQDFGHRSVAYVRDLLADR